MNKIIIMNFLQTSDMLQSKDLNTVEIDLKIKFPIDFKNHYLRFNGGYPEKDKYLWDDNENTTTTINTFFSIKYKGFGNLETTYRNLVLSEKYLPKDIIPFATDDGGNFFCISCRHKDYNYIYYCNNDHYNPSENEEHLTLLTKSFAAFLNNLM